MGRPSEKWGHGRFRDLDFPIVTNDLTRWQGRWADQAVRLRDEGRYRTLGREEDAPFCHNDYLGLRRDDRVLRAIRGALDDGMPTTASGSRLLSGNLSSFQAFEGTFAKAAGFPAGLLFGSASEANRVAISVLVGRRDLVLHDELAHASLIDGAAQSGAIRKRFHHNSAEHLRQMLQETPVDGIRLVLTESVFSMDGDLAPLQDIHAVCKDAGALLLVDEAHAVGLWGDGKTGRAESLPKDGTLVATTHGFGKALASSGGMLCTVGNVVEAVVNTSRAFIFTTAPSPLAITAAKAAWEVSRSDTTRCAHLVALCQRLAAGLRDLGWALPNGGATPIFPLLCGGLERAVSLSEALHERGIPLRPIRPPTVPAGTERLRATVSADLDNADIDSFLEILRDV